MSRVLVIIDPQNCFMDLEGKPTPLPVTGAVDDMGRVAEFIRKNPHYYDEIIATADDHPHDHIAHANRWVNEDGEHPQPFTIIKYVDYVMGRWKAADPDDDLWQGVYLQRLEKTGRFHTIWPVHGQWGMSESWLVDCIYKALTFWKAETGKTFTVVRKGQHRNTEQFGVFVANVPIQGAPETGFNTDLGMKLNNHDEVHFVGEASSHCVKDSVNQYLGHIMPAARKRVTVFRDAMSPVAAVTDPETGEVIVDFPAEAESWLASLPDQGVKVAQIKDLVVT